MMAELQRCSAEAGVVKSSSKTKILFEDYAGQLIKIGKIKNRILVRDYLSRSINFSKFGTL